MYFTWWKSWLHILGHRMEEPRSERVRSTRTTQANSWGILPVARYTWIIRLITSINSIGAKPESIVVKMTLPWLAFVRNEGLEITINTIWNGRWEGPSHGNARHLTGPQGYAKSGSIDVNAVSALSPSDSCRWTISTPAAGCLVGCYASFFKVVKTKMAKVWYFVAHNYYYWVRQKKTVARLTIKMLSTAGTG